MVLVAAVVGSVLAASALTAEVVSDHVRQSATDEAVHSAESVVHGFVDPLLTEGAMAAPDSAAGRQIDAQLEQLVGSGNLLRVKIWGPDGTVLFSDLPALRGRQFEVDDDLEEAFDGEISHDVSDGTAAENEFEHGLADRLPRGLPAGHRTRRQGHRRLRGLSEHGGHRREHRRHET